MSDLLKKCEKYFLKQGGHDKFLRVIQYSMRIWVDLAKTHSDKLGKERTDSWIKMFNLVKRNLSATRRACRIGKQITVLHTLFKLIYNYKSYKNKKFNKFGNFYYVLFRAINCLLATTFFSLDHIFWAYLAGLHRNRDLTSRVAIINDYVWLSSSTTNIIYNLIEMSLTQKRTSVLLENLKNLNEEKNKFVSKESIQEELKSASDVIEDLSLDIVKHFCDVCVNFGFIFSVLYIIWIINIFLIG